MYLNIILNDYIPTLIGIPQLNAARILDPSVFGDDSKGSHATGNQVSCEFSLIYGFHTLISDRDDKYMQSLLQKVFPGKTISELPYAEYHQGIAAYLGKLDKDPSKRDLAGLTRDTTTGTFDNNALVNILIASTEDCAGTPPITYLLTSSCFQLGYSRRSSCPRNTRNNSISVLEYRNLERIPNLLWITTSQVIRFHHPGSSKGADVVAFLQSSRQRRILSWSSRRRDKIETSRMASWIDH